MNIEPFDLVIVLALLAMFVVGYAQGVVRRLLGIGAMVFALVLAGLIRPGLGQYLSNEWTTIAPSYSHMVAFGGVFLAAAITLSIGIQIAYRPAPLFPKYPVLDELLGGVLGVVEGIVILIAVMLILDPYYTDPATTEHVATGEFGLLRTLHGYLDPTLTAAILRDNIIPPILTVFSGLFPQDVRDAFASLR